MEEVIESQTAVNDSAPEEGRRGTGQDQMDEEVRNGMCEEVMERLSPEDDQRDGRYLTGS